MALASGQAGPASVTMSAKPNGLGQLEGGEGWKGQTLNGTDL